MYRKLSTNEIEVLKNNQCWADDWNNINVRDEFDAKQFNLVRFSGTINLGGNSKRHELKGGISVRSGIFNAKIHNCNIGNGVYITNVNQYIANYDIGDNVVISNVDRILIDGETTFGNGTQVAVLNETGGREVMIYDRLSSHLGYIMTLYRHKPDTIKAIEKLIQEYSDKQKSTRGSIGNNVSIFNCDTIINVKIGDNTVISGASRLEEGSINSTAESMVYIGCDVIAKHFIICSDTSVKDGAMLDKCFIGQGCEIGKQYSAENSLIFSNCVGMHGEACSIFAGPYTVTHHKSTLLIAGLYSFMNAGSGSNQSNHMYKLGPIHQGVIDRGSKTTSDSYILWPSKIGAFSVIMGRHYNHCDTSILPFSYLIETDNNTYIVPGVNLRTVGTIRDAKKWPKRDRRKTDKIDQINYNLLSPYTVHKMIKGAAKLNTIKEISGETSSKYSYENCIIRNSSLNNGIKFYNIAITKFIGNSIIKRLENISGKDLNELQKALKPSSEIGIGSWADIGGLLAPKKEILRILDDIADNKLNNLEDIHKEFENLHGNYYEYEWNWVYEKISNGNCGIDLNSANSISEYVQKWIDCVTTLDKMVYEDAKKEFTLSSKTGFGADGGKTTKQKDFENVRGAFESNDFVIDTLNHIKRKTELGEELINRLKPLIK